ncbi:hypothetical protein CEQ30_28520 [Nocardia brasiliensis]|nr:hypothetical protein CEQ30_28520 [Nocardia brasiliensis]
MLTAQVGQTFGQDQFEGCGRENRSPLRIHLCREEHSPPTAHCGQTLNASRMNSPLVARRTFGWLNVRRGL